MRSGIDELVPPEQIRSWLKAAFAKVGATTPDMLKDDYAVERAARFCYQSMPLPIRLGVRATMGEVGFTTFVFRVRDRMLELNTVDPSSLPPDQLKSLWKPEAANEDSPPLDPNDVHADEQAAKVDDAPELEATVLAVPGELPKEAFITRTAPPWISVPPPLALPGVLDSAGHVGAATRSSDPRRHGGIWVAAIAAAVIVGAGAVYFAMSGPSQKVVPPIIVTQQPSPKSDTAGGEAPATAPAAPPAASSAAPGPVYSPVAPATPTPAVALKSGKAVYASSCASCHTGGQLGSPRLGDTDAWAPILARSRASLYDSAIKGKGAMPPRGGDATLQDAEVKRAVDFMVAQAKTTTRAAAPKGQTAAPVPSPPAQAAPAPPAPVAAPKSDAPEWVRALRVDLQRCADKNFLERYVCGESARFKHCAPDRWNTVPECAVGRQESQQGNR